MNAAKSQQKYPINTNAANNTNHF